MYNHASCSQQLYLHLFCSIGPCSSSPCENGGSCLVIDGIAFTCTCTAGYTASTCSEAICTDQTCRNGGICVVVDFGFQCLCSAGYTGNECEEDDSDFVRCESTTCHNGGTCEEGFGPRFTCRCQEGFSGSNCSTDIDIYCVNISCLNGGRCIEGVGTSTSCDCAVDFTGERCQTQLPYCTISSCLNGGTCYELEGQEIECICLPRFTGSTCEIGLCLAETDVPLYPSSSTTYSWTATVAGSQQTQTCPGSCQGFIDYPTGVAQVVRQCKQTEAGAQWQGTDLSGCGFTSSALRLCEATKVNIHIIMATFLHFSIIFF